MKKIPTLCGFHTDVENPLPPHVIPKILYHAAINGDWRTAEPILLCNPNYVGDSRITTRRDTVLHIAALGGNTLFVRKLVNMLDPSDLELRNDNGSTAFCCAVVSGVVENARVMRDKNKEVATIRGYDELSPIHQAALMGYKEMVSYLYTVTPLEELLPKERIELLEATIRNNMYDVALNILNKDTKLALAKLNGNQSFLHMLVRKRIALTVDEQGIWRRFLGSIRAVFSTSFLCNGIEEESLARTEAGKLLDMIWEEYRKLPADEFKEAITRKEILHYAAKEGNVEFLYIILQSEPDLFLELNDRWQSILHVAVLYRQQNVVNYIYNKQGYKDFMSLIDEDLNNILHLAAMTEETFCKHLFEKEKEKKNMPESLHGLSTAALQFEREISWFKEVEKIVPLSFRDMRNFDDKTPKQLFVEEHLELRIEAEKSIRGTAKSCMLVATLIATVAFSAAFTVPGGNDDHTGIPIFRKQASFTVFTISDAVAMIYSMVSIVTFLSIVILRYTEDNFHVALQRLFLGLATLGVSIGGMLFAFTAAFFLVYNRAWQPILIAAFAGLPIASFLFLNIKLWIDAVGSMLLNLFRFTQQ